MKINEALKDEILTHLKRFDYLTIKQIRAIAGLSESYVYKVMNALRDYWNVFTDDGVNVYYLSKAGRLYTGSEKIRRKLTTATHYMMRTDMYLHVGRPTTWKNEVRITYLFDPDNPKTKKIQVVADALYELHGFHHIVEIDNSQKMNQNKVKIEKYRQLFERNIFGANPVLIWVTTSPYRQKLLKSLCEGLNVRIYLKGDLQ